MATGAAFGSYGYQPKASKEPKKKTASTALPGQLPPGSSHWSAQKILAWQQQHQSGTKPIDRWGVGLWTTNERSADWSASLSWLLNGTTSPVHATQIKVINHHQYVGNDFDGYIEVNPKKPRAGTPGGPALYGPARPGHKAKAGQPGGPALYGPANPKAGDFARHRLGAVGTNADEFLDRFDALAKDNPARFGQIQSTLFQAGYYGTDAPVLGSYSGTDQNAMIQAVHDAHTAGMPIQEFLADRAAKRSAQGMNAGPQRVPLTVQLTDPKSIEAAVNSPTAGSDAGSSNASQAIGRFLTPQELQGYINQIHNGERLTQTAADNAAPTYQSVGPGSPPLPKGGTVVGGATGTPSAQEIDLAAKQAHPAEYQATHMGEQASRIYQILGQHMAGGVTAS